jgi:Ca-activated chloride channel homolog
MKPSSQRWRSDLRKRLPWLLAGGLIALLVLGTLRNPNFWLTPDQHGDALFRAKKYKEAAKAYADPIRIGAAQYRGGDFEAAAKTFARVPGAIGAFDEGNALLFHGNYDGAIAAYQRALSVQPGWQPAEENLAIAVARKKVLEASGGDREKEQTDSDEPDEIVMDQKGGNKKSTPDLAAEGPANDQEFQVTWLRRVQTTPGDFLKAKFAYQAGLVKNGGTK